MKPVEYIANASAAVDEDRLAVPNNDQISRARCRRIIAMCLREVMEDLGAVGIGRTAGQSMFDAAAGLEFEQRRPDPLHRNAASADGSEHHALSETHEGNRRLGS